MKPSSRGFLGCGALDTETQIRALNMLASNTQQAVADKLGVSKNVIAGLWNRRGNPQCKPDDPEPQTLYDRMDALDAAFEEATRG